MIKKIISNKRIILLSVIIVTLILLLIIFKIFNLKNKNDKNINFVELFNDQNIDNLKKINVIENNEIVISNKYKVSSVKKYESIEELKLDNLHGKLIYVRGKEMNANIYRIEFFKDGYIEEIPIIVQIDQYIKSFTSKILDELSIPQDLKPIEDNLSGKTKYKFEIPVEEAIYKYKMLYTKTYEYKNKKYEFNYYMNGKNFICEIVNKK